MKVSLTKPERQILAALLEAAVEDIDGTNDLLSDWASFNGIDDGEDEENEDELHVNQQELETIIKKLKVDE